jgi:hypothetical protein
MYKKGILIMAFFLAIQILTVSCFRQTQKCKGQFNNAKFLVAKDLPYPTFSTFKDSTIVEIEFDSLTIQTFIEGETFDCFYAQLKSILVKSAYAFKPAPPQVTIIDRIDSIHYTTLRNFDASHIKGSIVDDILYHTLGNSNNWTGGGIPTSSLTSEYNVSLSKTTSYASIGHSSRLSSKPAINGDTVQLAIHYYLNNGKIFSDTSTKFILKY